MKHRSPYAARTTLLSGLLTLLVAACVSGDTLPAPSSTNAPDTEARGGTAPETGSDDWSWLLEEPFDPIQLQVVADESSAVEAIIPIEGGTLSVTGADGTRYTLEIPADVLVEETTIRMTPVESIEGLPWGDESALAVRLEPEGIHFLDFVDLIVEPASDIPVAEQILFGFEGPSNDLLLALPSLEPGEIRLKLLHFSGYGVTKGFLADTKELAKRIGGDHETRISSLAAAAVQAARESDGTLDLESHFDAFYERVVKPRIERAGESCAAARLALTSAVGLERQSQLLGGREYISPETFTSLLETGSKICLQEEFELCRDDHIVHRIVFVWLGIERVAQLLGAPEGGSSSFEEGARLVEQCLRFELEFTSTAEVSGADGTYTSVVRARVPIRVDPLGYAVGSSGFTGKSALTNDLFEFDVPDCGVENRRGGGTFRVETLKWVVEFNDKENVQNALGHVKDLALVYFPGATTESAILTCYGRSFTIPPAPWWTAAFMVAHQDEMMGGPDQSPQVPTVSGLIEGMSPPSFDDGGAAFVTTGWTIVGGELYATKEWVLAGDGGVTEEGSFSLYHRPGS